MYNKLTENDIQEMEKEIEHRKLVLRPQLLEEVKETRAHGDLSENFEYHAAKREKNRNESRIRFLEKMIRTAKVIEDTSADDEVGVGKTVTIYIPEDDEEETYTIVSTMRQDSIHGFISVESPMGRALLGHREGDRIRVRVSDSYSYEAQIRKISLTDAADEAKIRSF
jgi:transcription elongation factor GreA